MADRSHSATPEQTPKIDTTVAHSARVWNYWLGGKDNFAVDRAAGDMVSKVFPGIVNSARYARAFLGRAVRFLAGEAGIRQFLDIGTGLPTADNTHQIAQRVAADSRIVYVDNDPLVLVHARALLTSSPEGATDYLEADIHRPDDILRGVTNTLDFSRPVAIMLMGIMGHLADDDEVVAIIDRLLAAVPSGSFLALTDGTNTSSAAIESHRQYNESGPVPYHLRSPAQLARFFDGLTLVEPGLVRVTDWRPDPDAGPVPVVDGYAAVGRKP